MKKKLLLLFITIITLTLVTGCLPKKEKPKLEPTTPFYVTEENLEDFDKIANLVFKVDKESYKTEDMTEEDKASIARQLPDNGFLEVTGTEMTKMFQKYFGKNQTVTFKDIDCGMDHGNKEENTLYIFDKEKDKYVYNEKHPGHGGSASVDINSKIEFNSIEIEKDIYRYYVKVLFFGPMKCQDIGPCSNGKAYKTYKDAKDGTNALTDIDKDYTTEDSTGFPVADLNKVMRDYREQLNEYEFDFVKEGNNFIFKGYTKK